MAKLTAVGENWRCGVCDHFVTIAIFGEPTLDGAMRIFGSAKEAIEAGWRPYAVLRNYRTDKIEPPFIWRFVCPEHADATTEELQRIIDAGPAPHRWEIADYATVVGPEAGSPARCQQSL